MAEETTKPTPETDFIEMADTTLGLMRLLNKQSKKAVAEAIKDPAKAESMADENAVLYQLFTYALWGIRDKHPDKYAYYSGEFSAELSISVDELTRNIAEASRKEDEESPVLPGFEDTEDAKRLKIKGRADKLSQLLKMAQRDGYNRIRGITPKNTTPERVKVETEHGGKMTDAVKMERISRKGDRASVTLRFDPKDEAKIETIAKKWRVSAKMLMDYAVIKLTAQNNYIGIPKRGKGDVDTAQIQAANRLVKFPLEEWCEMRGIPDTKASLDHERQTVIEDCKTLLYTTLEWEERRKDGKRKGWRGLNPFPFAEVKNNEVKIEIGTTLAAYLLTSPVMPYRPEFLRIDNRTPNAYLIATKLAELCNINGHRKAKPSYIVSVSALLDATDYPTKEYVYKEMNRRYIDCIINPFIKAMREIEAVSSLQWGFCLEGGKPLTEGMQPDKKIDDFLTAYIKYNFTDEQALENLQETT